MKRLCVIAVATLAGFSWPCIGNAEILALLNYESKPADALKAYKTPVPGQTRQEGIALVDVDPASAAYGKIVETIPLPADLVAHHIFYNRDSSKAYVTALGKGELRVIDMSKRPFNAQIISVPDCQVGEDVVFSEDNKTWYLTCMGSSKLIVGDAVNDKPIKTISLPKPYPHGVAVHNGIDRLLLTSTVRQPILETPAKPLPRSRPALGMCCQQKVSNKPSQLAKHQSKSCRRPIRRCVCHEHVRWNLWTATKSAKKDLTSLKYRLATVKRSTTKST